MDRIEELRVFIAVADGRSFAQAARRLNISPAQASKLVAPIAVTVVELNVAAGDVVTPTGSPLAVVADLRSLAAVVSVAEADAAKVAVGQQCVVQVGANRTEFPGVVIGVGATLDLGTSTISVRVRVRLEEGKRPPPAGSFVVVRFGDQK